MNNSQTLNGNGVCTVCGVNVEQVTAKYGVHVCLVKLDVPEPCGEQLCDHPAHWKLGSIAVGKIATCDECIMTLLERLPDNREWLAPALVDIRQRRLRVGARVRIQAEPFQGQLGTIYRQGNRWSNTWYVLRDGTRTLCILSDELDPIL